MNRNSITGTLVLLIIAIAGIWYYSSQKVSPLVNILNTEQTNPTKTEAAVTAKSNTSKAAPKPQSPNTFRSIFTQTGSHQCSYAGVKDSVQYRDEIYIADGKMRGEFRSTSNAGGSSQLMIYDKGYLYVWKEGTTNGTRTAIKSVADLPATIPKDLTGGSILGSGSNSIGWDCHAWLKDPAMLAVPAYVKF